MVGWNDGTMLTNDRFHWLCNCCRPPEIPSNSDDDVVGLNRTSAVFGKLRVGNRQAAIRHDLPVNTVLQANEEAVRCGMMWAPDSVGDSSASRAEVGKRLYPREERQLPVQFECVRVVVLRVDSLSEVQPSHSADEHHSPRTYAPTIGTRSLGMCRPPSKYSSWWFLTLYPSVSATAMNTSVCASSAKRDPSFGSEARFCT